MNLKKIFRSFLHSFDLYSEPVTLTFNKRKKISSTSGIFFSLLLLGLVISISHFKLESVFFRSNVYLENHVESVDSPPFLDIKNKFAITFSPIEYVAISGVRYFDFNITMGGVFKLLNGTQISTSKTYNLVPCNKSHFPMIKEDALIQSGMKNWICPDFNDESLDFLLKGTFGNDIYKYVRISIRACSKTNNLEPNTRCANEQEIKIMRKNYSKIYFNLILINNLIDLNNFDSPLKPIIEFPITLLEPNKTFVQKEFYLQNITVETDPTQSFNIFRSKSKDLKENGILFNGKVDNFVLTDISSSGLNYASLFLRVDNLKQNFVRRYDCFQDYLQSFGSLYSIFFLFFKIINGIFSKNSKITKIAKALYNIDDENKNQESKKHKIKFSILRNILNFFYALFNRLKVFGYQTKLVEEQINSELDIINIIISLKRLNNLKFLLMTDEQRLLFDLTGKEKFQNLNFKVVKNNKKNMKSLYNNSSPLKSPGRKDDFFENIKATFDYLKNDSKQSEISKKLCTILEKNNFLSLAANRKPSSNWIQPLKFNSSKWKLNQ